jgi:hypothetical protein
MNIFTNGVFFCVCVCMYMYVCVWYAYISSLYLATMRLLFGVHVCAAFVGCLGGLWCVCVVCISMYTGGTLHRSLLK